jgi:hypothetical protein
MKAFPVVFAAAIAATLLSLAPPSRADSFTEACMLGSNPGSGMGKTCECMAARIPAESRADAAEALRRSWEHLQKNSSAIDPSTLPQNLMKGLQAAVLAQSYCM